jgi:hypothetical protein
MPKLALQKMERVSQTTQTLCLRFEAQSLQIQPQAQEL